MLQHNHLNIFLAESCFVKGPQEKYVWVGSASDRDLFASQILDLLDRTVFSNHQSRPLWTGVNVDSFDRVAIRLSDQSCGSGGRAEIDALAVEQFQCFIAPETLGPLNRNPIAREILLEKTLVLQNQAHRVVIGIVEPDDFRLRASPIATSPDHSRNREQHGQQNGRVVSPQSFLLRDQTRSSPLALLQSLGLDTCRRRFVFVGNQFSEGSGDVSRRSDRWGRNWQMRE